jgi:hypothetical protein
LAFNEDEMAQLQPILTQRGTIGGSRAETTFFSSGVFCEISNFNGTESMQFSTRGARLKRDEKLSGFAK